MLGTAAGPHLRLWPAGPKVGGMMATKKQTKQSQSKSESERLLPPRKPDLAEVREVVQNLRVLADAGNSEASRQLAVEVSNRLAEWYYDLCVVVWQTKNKGETVSHPSDLHV